MDNCSLYVLLNKHNERQAEGCTDDVCFRMSINGEQKQDVYAQPIAGLQDTYMVKTQVPESSRVCVTQLEGYGDDTDMHAVDIDSNILLHMAGDNEPNKLQLNPGRQLMFILQSPWEHTAVGIRGSMYELGKWTQQPHNQVTMHIPNIGSLVAVPVESKDETIEFNLVRKCEDGKEWESAPRTPSIAQVSAASDTQVIVSSWHDPAVHKTDIRSSSVENLPQKATYKAEEVVTVTDIVAANKAPHNKTNNPVMSCPQGDQNMSGSSPAVIDTPGPTTLASTRDNSSDGDSKCKLSTGDQNNDNTANSHAWSIFRAHPGKKFSILQNKMTDCQLLTFTTPLDRDDGEENTQDNNFL